MRQEIIDKLDMLHDYELGIVNFVCDVNIIKWDSQLHENICKIIVNLKELADDERKTNQKAG